MNEDELKNALHEAAPEGPSPDGWAAAARGRAARARGGAMAAVGTSLAVIGALVAVNLPTGGTIGVPASSPAGTAAPAMPVRAVNPDCIGDLTPATKAPTAADGAGVVRATLCPAATGQTFSVPADSLTTLAPRLFETVVGLPWVAPFAPCEGDYDVSTRRYLVVFTSGDGARLVLDATTADGCPPPTDPDAITRWTSLAKDIEGLWQQERAPRAPESATAPCADWHRPSLLSVEPAQLTAGAVCGYAVDGFTVSTLERSRLLSAEDLAVLVADLDERARPGTNIDSPPTGRQLSLQSAWGNPLVFWETDGHQWFAMTGRGLRDQLYWDPGVDAAATIERAFAVTNPLGTTPAGTPQPAPAALCLPRQTSAGAIPEAALRLTLCASNDEALRQITPLDSLEAEGAQQVLARLLKRPQAQPDRACTLEFGPTFQLIAEYSGREPIVIELQTYGCRVVGTSTDQRLGAEVVLDAFRTALAEQRARSVAAAGPPAQVNRPGWVCIALVRPSVMPIVPKDVRAGEVCRFPRPDTNDSDARGPIPAAQLAELRADLAAHSEPWEARRCLLATARPVFALALLNVWGDVLAVAPDGCVGSYTYVTGGKRYLWTPTASVAAAIERAAG